MNFETEKRFQNKGASIRPSARRSIHNHGTYCPYWISETMLRADSRTKDRHDKRDLLEGTDEVDNVLSKFPRPSSPLSIRRNENIHNSSLNSLRENISDDSDEDSILLSKSSPAILCPNCSEELEDNPVSNDRKHFIVSTNSSSPQKHNASLKNGNSPSTAHSARRNIVHHNVCQSTSKNSYTFIFSIIITLLTIVAAIFYGKYTLGKEANDVIYDKFSFYNDVNGVGTKYKIHDSSILQVQTGIATIFEKEDTGSFIFPYNSDKSNFNLASFNNFVNELASAAAKYLRNSTKVIQHVVVDSVNLKLLTAKELMNEYHADVDKTGVMLVKELDRVPSNVAMAFHYYCDEDNPLVKKSAIFFTLNMARCPNISNEKNTRENIEKCLTNKWETIPRENICPLLTRVVNVVVDVLSNF